MKFQFFIPLAISLLPLLSPFVRADSMTGFQVVTSTKSNGDLEIRTTEIWNGDDYIRSKWTYGTEQIVFFSCDEKWSCVEDKGSAYGRYYAYPKAKGWGYVLVRVASGYESIELDKIWVVDHEKNKRAIVGLKFGCHDLNWSKDGTQLILSDQKESISFELNSGGLIGRAPRDDSKLGALLRRNECPG